MSLEVMRSRLKLLGAEVESLDCLDGRVGVVAGGVTGDRVVYLWSTSWSEPVKDVSLMPSRCGEVRVRPDRVSPALVVRWVNGEACTGSFCPIGGEDSLWSARFPVLANEEEEARGMDRCPVCGSGGRPGFLSFYCYNLECENG